MFVIACVYDDNYSNRGEVILHCCYDLHYLNISNIEHLFIYLLAVYFL